MGTSEGVRKSWLNLTADKRQLRCQHISESLAGKVSIRVKNYWLNMSQEKRLQQLRGLLSLTSEQHRNQAVKGGITRRGKPSPAKGSSRSEITKQRISEAVKRGLANMSPEKKAEMRRNHALAIKGKTHFERHPEVARQCGINFWKDPDKAKKLIGHKPNKSELRLNTLLQKHFPDQWKYVGNGKVWLGHRCPDFININGKKALIELFGVHWHNVLSAGERTEYFRQFGFNTLVIWEEELKNEVPLIKRVRTFARK